jgi:hypothetical protein
MKEHKKLPLYDIVFDPASEDSGTNRIDWVKKPANGKPLLKFSEEKQTVKLEFDEERRLVTAVVMQPNYPMLRDIKGEKFFVQFPKESIELMRDKFMMLKKTDEAGVEHQEAVEGVFMVETWIVDESRGISAPKELEAEDGSWIGTFRILNDGVWSGVKDGTFEGVSLEGIFDLYETFSAEQSKIEEGLLNIFKNTILNSDTSIVSKFNALKSLCK